MYGYIGSMRTRPGKRDEVIDLLLRGLDSLPAAGCHSYVVSACAADADRIWVTEVWESAEHHAASLQLPETQAAIAACVSGSCRDAAWCSALSHTSVTQTRSASAAQALTT